MQISKDLHVVHVVFHNDDESDNDVGDGEDRSELNLLWFCGAME